MIPLASLSRRVQEVLHSRCYTYRYLVAFLKKLRTATFWGLVNHLFFDLLVGFLLAGHIVPAPHTLDPDGGSSGGAGDSADNYLLIWHARTDEFLSWVHDEANVAGFKLYLPLVRSFLVPSLRFLQNSLARPFTNVLGRTLYWCLVGGLPALGLSDGEGSAPRLPATLLLALLGDLLAVASVPLKTLGVYVFSLLQAHLFLLKKIWATIRANSAYLPISLGYSQVDDTEYDDTELRELIFLLKIPNYLFVLLASCVIFVTPTVLVVFTLFVFAYAIFFAADFVVDLSHTVLLAWAEDAENGEFVKNYKWTSCGSRPSRGAARPVEVEFDENSGQARVVYQENGTDCAVDYAKVIAVVWRRKRANILLLFWEVLRELLSCGGSGRSDVDFCQGGVVATAERKSKTE